MMVYDLTCEICGFKMNENKVERRFGEAVEKQWPGGGEAVAARADVRAGAPRGRLPRVQRHGAVGEHAGDVRGADGVGRRGRGSKR